MSIPITYWRDVERKLTTTEMDNNFQNIVDAISDAGLSSTMPEGQIYIGDNTNTASLDILDTSIVPETTDRNYQTDNQNLFNDATSSIQTQINSKEPTIASGTISQYWRGDKTWQTFPTISTPNLDEVTDVGNTTTNSITVGGLIVNNPSGSGVAANITKGGAGEALTVTKISGSGNVASLTGGTTLISQLDLTTPLADSEIASATIWNGKFNTPTGLNTNNTIKWNGSQLVNANETDNGTTITSTLNRVFNGASAANNIIGSDTNKFLFNGVNTIATGSFVQISPEMQVSASTVGGSLRGIFYLDASSNTYANNGYSQLYINSGGDLIGSKISMKEAISIIHRSGDNINNGNHNSSAINIDAIMNRPRIATVSKNAKGVHHITSLNSDNYSSIIQTGSSGSSPIHYSAYSQRDDTIAFSHYRDATVSSGILNHARNIISSPTTTFSSGFGFKTENYFITNNVSTYLNFEEETIVANVGAGTTTTARRFKHVNIVGGISSSYIMGLYASGVIIGDTTALPNTATSLELHATNKGFLKNRLTTSQKTSISSPVNGLNVYDTDLATDSSYTTRNSINAWIDNKIKYSELFDTCLMNGQVSPSGTSYIGRFKPKCDMIATAIEFFVTNYASSETFYCGIYDANGTKLSDGSVSVNTSGDIRCTITNIKLTGATTYFLALKDNNLGVNSLGKCTSYGAASICASKFLGAGALPANLTGFTADVTLPYMAVVSL